MDTSFLKEIADTVDKNGYQIAEIREECIDVHDSEPMLTGAYIIRIKLGCSSLSCAAIEAAKNHPVPEEIVGR